MESTPVFARKIRASAHWMQNQPLSWLMTGQVVAAIVGLIYGKLTAIYIVPAELGLYNLFFAGMMLLYSLLISPTIQSFKATLTQQPVSEAARTHGGLLVAIYGLTLLLIGFVLLMDAGATGGFLFLVWLAALGQGLYAVGNDYLNIKGRYKELAAVQVGYALVCLLAFILICINLGYHTAGGLWYCLALPNLLFTLIATRHLWRTVAGGWKQPDKARSDFDFTANLRATGPYILPLMGTALWSWLISYADRYLIRLYLTDADVGLYTMGYSLGSKLLLLATPIVTYLTGVAIREKANGESIRQFRSRQLNYTLLYTGFAAVGCLVFYASREWVGLLFMSPQYKTAFSIAPLIAFSYLFITTIYLFEIRWYVYGGTKYILWHNVFGALCNIGLNSWLIPRYGLSGAAFAMIGSTVGQFSLVVYLTYYRHEL